jgi:hypothetical protein
MVPMPTVLGRLDVLPVAAVQVLIAHLRTALSR